ncbi:FmdB family zinc ribbon protein [Nocardiopsis flavescens]|uniref:Putative regulatory protein, FmdB family n=1 Tax=Nocardiopsis flavescens TaxID=758803 RepID=A0A1M6G8Q2_9ACTN|nr:FmdB family zinc ribbon protein [Nocardiopsis flavescens]SHJ06350.1 putative regulatory protein, FmdB family [Nocardiopsis flavescens]
MPTYQYACTECGAQMEVVQSFSDDALTVCPECEGRLRKVYSAVGIVFKGSGFYRTDSGKTSNSSTMAGSGASTAPAADSGAAKPSSGSDTSSTSSSSSPAKSESTSGSTAKTAATGG